MGWPPFQGKFDPAQRKKIKCAEKICHHWNHGAALGAENAIPDSWCFGMTHKDNDGRATVGSEPLTQSWQALRRALTGKRWEQFGLSVFFWVFCVCFFLEGLFGLFVFLGGCLFCFFWFLWFVFLFVVGVSFVALKVLRCLSLFFSGSLLAELQ